MKTWQVNYNATYWVQADSEDDAIELGIEEHGHSPDGSWEAFIDPWESNTEGED
jgi:hypothetical protein